MSRSVGSAPSRATAGVASSSGTGCAAASPRCCPRPGYQEWLGHDVAYCAIVPEVERSDGLTRFGAAVSEAADEAIDNALDRGWRPGPVVGVIHAIVLGEVELWKEFYLEREPPAEEPRVPAPHAVDGAVAAHDSATTSTARS